MPDVVGRFRMPRLDVAPANPRMGEMFFHQIKRVVCFWDGTIWVDLISIPQAGGDLTGTYPNPTLAVLPFARMAWTGTKDVPAGVLCSCSGTPGTTGLGITMTAQFHSGDPAQMDLTKGRLVAKRRGLYQVNASASFGPANDARARGLGVRFNDGPAGEVAAASVPCVGTAGDTLLGCSGLWPLEAGETVEVNVIHGATQLQKLTSLRVGFAFLTPIPTPTPVLGMAPDLDQEPGT